MTEIEELIEVERQIAALEEQRDALVDKVDPTAVLTARLQPIFDAFPQVKSLGWIQYVPYFNDGDPCTWSIIGPGVNPRVYDDLSEEEKDDWDGNYEEMDSWSLKYHFVMNGDSDDPYHVQHRSRYPGFDRQSVEAILEALKPLENWLERSEYFLNKLFGHAVIVVKRDGTASVSEFDHD